jgi:ferritin
MISKKMEAALNKQINNELYSAYLYMAMSACATTMGFKGTANWFAVQAREEMEHAKRFYKYVLDQMAEITLDAIKQPAAKFSSILDMFEQALKHEKFITKCISDLADLAAKENDHATGIMLQWFVTEQIEEEANPAEIAMQLKMAGSSAGTLLMVDHQLAKREFKG